MKPPRFEYHDPKSVDEVVALLGTLENAKVLAGGQSLMPMLNMRIVLPSHLVDLERVEGLAGIRIDAGGDALVFGAMTRQADIEASALVRERCPLMHEAILQVGHRQTRNRGTIGGSLCHLDPSAELPVVAAAIDAEIVVRGPRGERRIAFADFPVALMTPAIEADELVTEVRVPLWPQAHGFAFVEFARRHGDFAMASAGAMLMVDGAGRVTRAALALGGVATSPVRMREVEAALVGEHGTPERFAEAAEACRAIEALHDVHAPASYRQQLAVTMARRALLSAHERATKAAGKA